MSEWSCSVCNAVNGADNSICSSCGARRPEGDISAVGSEAESGRGTENKENSFESGDEETVLMERISSLARSALYGGAEAEKFTRDMGVIFGDLEAFIDRLNQELRTEEERTAARLTARLSDSYSLFQLAWAHFADYSPDNKQTADLGLLLAEQAYEALHWTADYLRRHNEPGGAHYQNMIGRAAAGLINGEIDRQAYAEAIAGADRFLQETIDEGKRRYFSALREAEGFDGNNYKVMLPVAESAESVGKIFAEAILAVHAG